MTSTQSSKIYYPQFGEYLKNHYKKKFSLQLFPPWAAWERLEVTDQLDQKDSFRCIHFPLIKDGTRNYLPVVYLSGLDNHLKSQGKAVQGPLVPFPGLLAQCKYSEIDFNEATRDPSWSIEYKPQSVNAVSFDVTVEGGWRKLKSNHRFSFNAQVLYDSSLFDLFHQIISTSGMGESWGGFSQTITSERDLLLFIATSAQDDPLLGPKSVWKLLESMEIEEFAGLVWKCIVQKRPLRTALMTESEFESLEMTAKGKKVERKERDSSDYQMDQARSKIERISLNSRDELLLRNMNRAIIKKLEDLHRKVSNRNDKISSCHSRLRLSHHRLSFLGQIDEILRILIRMTQSEGSELRYDPRAFDDGDSESEIALTETTVDEPQANSD